MQHAEGEWAMSGRNFTVRRRSKLALVVLLGVLVSGTACSSDEGDKGDDKPSESGQEGNGGKGSGGKEGEQKGPLGEAKSGDGIKLTVNTAKRDSGGFVTVTGEVANEGSEVWTGVAWKSDEKELAEANPNSVAGARLVDQKGKKRYYILRDTEGKCLCTSFTGGLTSGKSKTWYAQFPAPPKGNDTVDFQIADLPAVEITLSGGE